MRGTGTERLSLLDKQPTVALSITQMGQWRHTQTITPNISSTHLDHTDTKGPRSDCLTDSCKYAAYKISFSE